MQGGATAVGTAQYVSDNDFCAPHCAPLVRGFNYNFTPFVRRQCSAVSAV